MKRYLVIATVLCLAGCATASRDISAAYISPIVYSKYDCGQLTEELQRITVKVQQLGGQLDEAAANDKALTGVGALIFWPALFALGGNKEQEAEYSRLKGEYDAVEQTMISKKCSTANT